VSFDAPLALLALMAVPVAAAAYLLYDRRRKVQAARFSAPALYPNVVARAPGRLRHLPVVVLLLALTVLLTGFARPHATISVPREEATVVLALDVSRSMTAPDVRPTRLAAAQAAARQFLEDVPEDYRIGVVRFATRANVVAPPTEDRDYVAAALRQVRAGEGTALGEAVELSLRAIRQTSTTEEGERIPASILLISDGAQTVGRVTPAQAARRARSAGVPVHTVALGTPDGVVERRLPGGFTERVRVPPDPDALRGLAEATGGDFNAVLDRKGLRRVYEELGSRLGERDKRAEVTVAFAGAGLALLLAAGALGVLLLRRLP
jgi:Ca-activated chloride channel family protein